MLIFVTVIYFATPEIGGISGMFEKLTQASVLNPVEGNAFGSYLTLASIGGSYFWCDQYCWKFWNCLCRSVLLAKSNCFRPKAATGGFILGGLAWFAIPFTLATTLGLAAISTGITLTENEIGLGLVAPTAAAI